MQRIEKTKSKEFHPRSHSWNKPTNAIFVQLCFLPGAKIRVSRGIGVCSSKNKFRVVTSKVYKLFPISVMSLNLI